MDISVDDFVQILLAIAAVFCGALGQWNRLRIGNLELALQQERQNKTPAE